MTVRELIEKLEKIENKESIVSISLEITEWSDYYECPMDRTCSEDLNRVSVDEYCVTLSDV